jgi:hypothetical protein
MHDNTLLLFNKYATAYSRRNDRALEVGPGRSPSAIQQAINNPLIGWESAGWPTFEFLNVLNRGCPTRRPVTGGLGRKSPDTISIVTHPSPNDGWGILFRGSAGGPAPMTFTAVKECKSPAYINDESPRVPPNSGSGASQFGSVH